jgi:hypothetical protein
MKRWKLIAYTSGILIAYYCMSIWGMGMRNPVKYYLYLPVLLCSFLLVKEIQQTLQPNNDDTMISNMVFIATLALILTGCTAFGFSIYESFVIKNNLRY